MKNTNKNSDNKIRENEIAELIEEYFELPKGRQIDHPLKKIFIDMDICISCRALKHIIEARKEDNYDIVRIWDMFIKIPETLHEPDFVMPNWNKKYPQSLISAKFYLELDHALLVIHSPDGKIIDVINAFFRNKIRYESLKAKAR